MVNASIRPLFVGSLLFFVISCGSTAGSVDAGATLDDAASAIDGAGNTAADADTSDARTDDARTDDFERTNLGPNWTVRFPTPPTQVQIIGDTALGMAPGPQGFFLANWTGTTFAADQFCEASIAADTTPGWAYMVYVRWRAADSARYGFAYNSDPNQPSFGNWIFKYDGVASNQTRVFATAPTNTPPQPGDTLRIEVIGYTLRGYHNGQLVLMATDTDPSRIANGETGLAARWSSGNQQTNVAVKVFEAWSGGSL